MQARMSVAIGCTSYHGSEAGLSELSRKLRLRSVSELVRYAIRTGIVQPWAIFRQTRPQFLSECTPDWEPERVFMVLECIQQLHPGKLSRVVSAECHDGE